MAFCRLFLEFYLLLLVSPNGCHSSDASETFADRRRPEYKYQQSRPQILRNQSQCRQENLGSCEYCIHFPNSYGDCLIPFDKIIAPSVVKPVRICQVGGEIYQESFPAFTISTKNSIASEIILDYGYCVGGIPVFEISKVCSNGRAVEIDVVYSESREGADNEQGDGPYFLFSNAMNSYRRETLSFEASAKNQVVRSRHAQQSQRYQKIILKAPNSSITFSSIGFKPVSSPSSPGCSFTCSDETLNRVYRSGTRTLQMCTLAEGDIPDAWEVTMDGTRVFGQHWAPCREGTRWGDKIVNFDLLVERAGASWGIHMVANGLIFCLDSEKRSIVVYEGLSHLNSVFPTIERGSWPLPTDLDTSHWLAVQVEAVGASVVLRIDNFTIGRLDGLNIHPLLGGSGNNTGSVAFGGPAGYVTLYRNLVVRDNSGQVLYENDFSSANKYRTMADFAVGTNALPCTIDGAKRDRAVFAGDLYVMGRSIYHSTGKLEAVKGSLELLSSHQTAEGYLGNLCPVQAPVHETTKEPPTYAFYSLSYSLLLIVTSKDYWLHSGDQTFIAKLWPRFEKLIDFTARFIDERGLVVAPPPLSMDWFPLGGPIFGASGKINLAYYEALTSLATMSASLNFPDKYTSLANALKESMLRHLWSEEASIMRMSDSAPPTGICQDVSSYAITTGVAPSSRDLWSSPTLPLAFQSLPGWDRIQIVSPYASGFAAESQFAVNNGFAAVDLIKRVWGTMVDPAKDNFSGGHWEAMKADGTPFGHDTSLAHGWSTWPVFLLPKYLAGVEPLEAGWKKWRVRPVLAGLAAVDVSLDTVVGRIEVALRVDDNQGRGDLTVLVPRGTICEICAPIGWAIEMKEGASVVDEKVVVAGADEEIVVLISRVGA